MLDGVGLIVSYIHIPDGTTDRLTDSINLQMIPSLTLFSCYTTYNHIISQGLSVLLGDSSHGCLQNDHKVT